MFFSLVAEEEDEFLVYKDILKQATTLFVHRTWNWVFALSLMRSIQFRFRMYILFNHRRSLFSSSYCVHSLCLAFATVSVLRHTFSLYGILKTVERKTHVMVTLSVWQIAWLHTYYMRTCKNVFVGSSPSKLTMVAVTIDTAVTVIHSL